MVSTWYVFKKFGHDEDFGLTGYLAIKENCGRDLQVSPKVMEVASLIVGELRMLRLLDTPMYYLGK